MTFGEKLRQLRVGQKMTQKQLADKLNVSKSVISYYELGEKFPSHEMLIKISQIFRVPIDNFFGIERKTLIDVSDLSDDDVAVVISVANALKRK